jgi:hypothetical protein
MSVRRPRSFSAAPSRRQYLFSEQVTVYELTLALHEKLKKELSALPAEALLHRSAQEVAAEIIEQYTLKTPQLDRNNIAELPPQETQIQVPQFTQNRAFFSPGPHFVPATAYSIRIPFTGDPNLFRYPTSGYGVHIEAEVVDGALILTHTTETPDPAVINREFDSRMTQIEQALQFVREQAGQWNQRLPGLVQPAIEKRHATLQRNHGVSLGYPKAQTTVEPVAPAIARPPRSQVTRYDVFLSHASEDKETIARPLYEALTAAGVSVWFDEAVLKLGDSLSARIDEGLAKCTHGIIIISPSFLDKRWPQRELAGLVAREVAGGEKRILPIWHDIDHATLVERSLTLADRVAGRSSEGIAELVRKILEVVR